MKRIACNSSIKLRLRGVGSGFLEDDGMEASMPLQLDLSCANYSSYVTAVEKVALLLTGIYQHYQRYSKLRGFRPPNLKLQLQELRRDDRNLNVMHSRQHVCEKQSAVQGVRELADGSSELGPRVLGQ